MEVHRLMNCVIYYGYNIRDILSNLSCPFALMAAFNINFFRIIVLLFQPPRLMDSPLYPCLKNYFKG